MIEAVQSATVQRPATSFSAPTVDYDAFLQLLIAQMQNQDPTEPMNSTDYVAQLATFSNVEQSVQINERLDSLIQANTIGQASDLIGRTLSAQDGSVTGTIEAVQIFSDGLIAVLGGGERVVIGPGVTLGA